MKLVLLFVGMTLFEFTQFYLYYTYTDFCIQSWLNYYYKTIIIIEEVSAVVSFTILCMIRQVPNNVCRNKLIYIIYFTTLYDNYFENNRVGI